MQKALRLTNIRLDVALNDVTGASGKAIIEAILGGERNPGVLAALTNVRVKKSREEIARALTGDWREKYLLELKQCYQVYNYFHEKIAECDQQIGKLQDEKIGENEKEDGEVRPVYLEKKEEQ